MNSLSRRHQLLQQTLLDQAPLAVAFSGGVDSSLLLKVAHDMLGERCVAITVDAPYLFREELADAARFAYQLGVQHLLVPFDPATVIGLMDNPPDRCYLCKHALLTLCLATLTPDFTLTDGSNLDDQVTHRPGRRALQELEVRSLLAETGFTKQQVRTLSRQLGLKTWDKPAQSCLLTRFPHRHSITETELERVEQVEMGLKELGLRVVRVRSLGTVARIECEEGELAKAMLPRITERCRKSGFTDVQIDPDGYRCGSMDQN